VYKTFFFGRLVVKWHEFLYIGGGSSHKVQKKPKKTFWKYGIKGVGPHLRLEYLLYNILLIWF